MSTIHLTKGATTLVDDQDIGLLSLLKWHYDPKVGACHSLYERGSGKRGRLLMHRYIMQPPRGFVVDHINGDKLDNRRENLRVCLQAHNTANQKPQQNRTSEYKGVTRDVSRGLWRAQIKYRGKVKFLGRYSDECDAALAYNRAAALLFGKYARPNELVKIDA